MKELLHLWCKTKDIQYEYDMVRDIHYFRRFTNYGSYAKGNQFALYGYEIREIEFGNIEYLLNTILNKLGVE